MSKLLIGIIVTTRFEPANYAEVYRAELKGRFREKDENLATLAQDIKRLIRKAYVGSPKVTRDKLACDSFIDSLNDADMEWDVFKHKPTSIDRALQFAMEYEAFLKARRHRHGDRRSLRLQSGQLDQATSAAGTAPLAMPQATALQPARQSAFSQGKQTASQCFWCHEVGHFKRDGLQYAKWCVKQRRRATQEASDAQSPAPEPQLGNSK